MTVKPAVTTVGGLKSTDVPNISSQHGSTGIAGTIAAEPQPSYIKADNETVIKNDNGAAIVLGRDRPSHRLSGYGGKGYSHCASIDIVAGRMSAIGPISYTPKGEKVYVDPNFTTDAARIHISQRTDIDKNFGLAAGKVGNSEAKSGIGIKADAVRLMGNEGIKLVTRPQPKNSQGGMSEHARGIDLIAGNDSRGSQPLVRGDNLVAALTALSEQVQDLSGIVDSLLLGQTSLNTALTFHTHTGVTTDGMPLKTFPSAALVAKGSSIISFHTLTTKVSLLNQRMKMALYKINYLKPTGKRYINSRYNTTN